VFFQDRSKVYLEFTGWKGPGAIETPRQSLTGYIHD